VGAGRSQEAAFALVDDLPAGEWKLVGDGVILQAVDVTFEVLVRRGGATPSDLPVVSWQQRFDPRPDGTFDAVPYEATARGAAVKVQSGDLLIFRYSGQSASSMNAYVPNGDGVRQNGRIPNLTLPR
jgi:hypothetical protein